MVTYCVRRCLLSAQRLISKVSTSGLARVSTIPAVLHQTNSFHTSSQDRKAFWLPNRAVVRVSGRDTVDLLQGLVTSNVIELADGHGTIAQYSMMLNVQGRVLYDLILYNQSRVLTEVCFLVECDASLKDEFIKVVKRYRIRKKMDITDVSDEYKVWAMVNLDFDPSQPLTPRPQGDGGEGHGVQQDQAVLRNIPNAVFCVEDPRVPLFGHRVIVTSGNESAGSCSSGYDKERYRWGIPEGPKDLPPGSCLPLESNLTIMNGVSFTKGCYVGQELTARTHHTGVIRKRLLPVVFDSEPPAISSEAPIVSEKSPNAGKFRAHVGRHGLGLIRLEHDSKPLYIKNNDSQIPVTTYRPGWWPEELRT